MWSSYLLLLVSVGHKIRITLDFQVMFDLSRSFDVRENQIDNISFCLLLLFPFLQSSFVAHFLRCLLYKCVLSLTNSTNSSRLKQLSGENGDESHSLHCTVPFAR